MAERLLMIEDDQSLAEMVAEHLGAANIEVLIQADGTTGLERLRQETFDAIVLDIMLPDMDGFEVCRRIRAESDIPILMLTARGDETDRIVGLELGGDEHRLPVLRFGRLEIDRSARAIRLDGEERELTGDQFDLLVALAESAGRVLSRDYLMNRLKDEPLQAFDRSIDVHVGAACRIRVEDHGPGVPEEEREKIFLPFYQATWNQGGR